MIKRNREICGNPKITRFCVLCTVELKNAKVNVIGG